MALNLQQQIEAVVDKATADATILHSIVHGNEHTDVVTEGGPVKTVAKAIKGVQDDLARSRTELTQQVTVATAQATPKTPKPQNPMYIQKKFCYKNKYSIS
jgi:hypothetical protein